MGNWIPKWIACSDIWILLHILCLQVIVDLKLPWTKKLPGTACGIQKGKIMPFCNFQCALFCEQSCGRGASILKMCWDLWKVVWTLVFWSLGFLYQQHKIHMLLQQISFYVGGRTWGILFSILIWLQLLYFVPKFCTLLAPLNLDVLCVRRLSVDTLW
jgi:hypothetical protein